MKKRNRKILHVGAWILFIIYLSCMVHFLFFSEQLGREVSMTYHYNLKPFAEIKRFLWMANYPEKYGLSVLLNLGGNIVCFMPMGMVLPILSRRKWRFIKVTVVCCMASCSVELLQFVTKLGSCDVDDIILNTIGGLLGYFLFLICHTMYVIVTGKNKRKQRKKS